ncbi:hypothetical protein [Hymenobacter algoricola]
MPPASISIYPILIRFFGTLTLLAALAFGLYCAEVRFESVLLNNLGELLMLLGLVVLGPGTLLLLSRQQWWRRAAVLLYLGLLVAGSPFYLLGFFLILLNLSSAVGCYPVFEQALPDHSRFPIYNTPYQGSLGVDSMAVYQVRPLLAGLVQRHPLPAFPHAYTAADTGQIIVQGQRAVIPPAGRWQPPVSIVQ